MPGAPRRLRPFRHVAQEEDALVLHFKIAIGVVGFAAVSRRDDQSVAGKNDLALGTSVFAESKRPKILVEFRLHLRLAVEQEIAIRLLRQDAFAGGEFKGQGVAGAE